MSEQWWGVNDEQVATPRDIETRHLHGLGFYIPSIMTTAVTLSYISSANKSLPGWS